MEVFLKLEFAYLIFYIVTLLWVGEFIVFPSKYKSDDYSEKSSFKKILAGVIACITFTAVLTYIGAFRVASGFGTAMHYLGLAFYVAGIILRYVGAAYLGKYFTRDVEVEKNHELVSTGPYRILRHPLYLGLFLLVVAVPLFFQNILAAFSTALIMGFLIDKRMVSEEEVMENTIGDTYREWKKKRYRFIPYIY